jgi:hypothetical protein
VDPRAVMDMFSNNNSEVLDGTGSPLSESYDSNLNRFILSSARTMLQLIKLKRINDSVSY